MAQGHRARFLRGPRSRSRTCSNGTSVISSTTRSPRTMEEALDVIVCGEGESEKWLHSFYYGNGTPGLRELVNDEHLGLIDARGVSTIPIGVDDTGHEIIVRVGRYGPYVQREDDQTASLPPDIAPDELTVDIALDLIAKQAAGPTALGDDPETGLPVFALTGRFGPYVQLGEQEQGTKKKPKRACRCSRRYARDGHARRSVATVEPAARCRRRRRGTRDRRVGRDASVRTSRPRRRRDSQSRCRSAALHRHTCGG